MICRQINTTHHAFFHILFLKKACLFPFIKVKTISRFTGKMHCLPPNTCTTFPLIQINKQLLFCLLFLGKVSFVPGLMKNTDS